MKDYEYITNSDLLAQMHEEQKAFMPDLTRKTDFEFVLDIINELFPLDSIEIISDPIQPDNLLIHIEVPYLSIMDKDQISDFSFLVDVVDNLEISNTSAGIAIDAVMSNVSIPQTEAANTVEEYVLPAALSSYKDSSDCSIYEKTIVDFDDLMRKKNEREQVREFLTEGKTPTGNYIEALEEELKSAHKYIDQLCKYANEQNELVQLQRTLIERLENK